MKLDVKTFFIIIGVAVAVMAIYNSSINESNTAIPTANVVKDSEPDPNAPITSKQEILARNAKVQSAKGQGNVAPTIMITEPDQDELVDVNPFDIWWIAEDGNNDQLVIKLQYQDQDGKWILLSENEPNDRTYQWDITNLENGRYSLRATISDGILSNYDTKSFTIRR